MDTGSAIKMIRCNSCKVTAPREVTELARPSGLTCLICGSRAIEVSVLSVNV